MKKLMFILLLAVVFFAGSARAQVISNEIYTPGSNNYGTFTWCIDSVGYLHYNLTDMGPVGTPGYYSEVIIVNDLTSEVYVFTQHGFWTDASGGSISGSVYIGTGDQFISVIEGNGFLGGYGEEQGEDNWWDFEISFPEDE